ncbi:MAG: ATP-dependent sacrificial sulfur transferase LarE [Pirellulaceae bacterium]|nr:ATP-dependent sacrificial sulfur transferase LarE [Pirellulaceae bacterium]
MANAAAKLTSKKLRRTGQVALGVGISVVYYHLILSFTNLLLLFAGVLFNLPSLLAITVWAQGILLLSSPIGMLICAFAPVPVSRRLVVLALVAQIVAVVFHLEPIEDPRLGVLASLVVQNLAGLLGLGSYMLFVEYLGLVGAKNLGVASSIQQIRNRTIFSVFFPIAINLGLVVVALLSVAFGGIFFVVVMSILVLIYLGVWLLWLKEYLELLSYLKRNCWAEKELARNRLTRKRVLGRFAGPVWEEPFCGNRSLLGLSPVDGMRGTMLIDGSVGSSIVSRQSLAYNLSMTNLDDKRDRLLKQLRSYGSCAVAFSAGVDSTVVAKAACLALGDQAVAATAQSPSLAQGELDEAKRLADLIGIRHLVIKTQEMANPSYQANDFDRCYHCKTELYFQLEGMADRLGVKVIANGANLDDKVDHRPGMRAAREHQVRSPLMDVGLTKTDVRELAAEWQLPVWNKPAMPCLSSRIAYGEEVTSERLRMIDDAERWLRGKGFSELRVRYHRGDLARIEVPAGQLSRLCESPLHTELVVEFQRLGFRFVTIDLQGFQSGSMNVLVPLERVEIS